VVDSFFKTFALLFPFKDDVVVTLDGNLELFNLLLVKRDLSHNRVVLFFKLVVSCIPFVDLNVKMFDLSLKVLAPVLHLMILDLDVNELIILLLE